MRFIGAQPGGQTSLKLPTAFSHRIQVIDAVLAFASHPQHWGHGAAGRYREAHQIVTRANLQHGAIFELAALAGKVAYTAQQHPAPFDHTAGWELVAAAQAIAEAQGDPALTQALWSAVADPSFLELDEPVRCHPGCPICFTTFGAPVHMT